MVYYPHKKPHLLKYHTDVEHTDPSDNDLIIFDLASGLWKPSAISTLGVDHTDLVNVTASQHHAKYLDAEAVSAMGAKADANALHHDRYTDAEAVAAIAAAPLKYFCAYRSGALNIPTGYNTVIPLTEINDDSGWHDNATNPSRITPDVPTGTILRFQAYFTIAAHATGARLLRLTSNASATRGGASVQGHATAHNRLNMVVDVTHTSGNYYEFYFWQNSGGTRAIQGGSDDSLVSVEELPY